MKKTFNFNREDGNISFEYSRFNEIDGEKYNLFDVLANPILDKLSFNNRFEIFKSFFDSSVRLGYANNLRYSTDGCGTVRTVTNPCNNLTSKMINFGSNDYLNMTQHPEVIEAGVKAIYQYGAGPGGASEASGLTDVKVNLEKEIANTFGYELAQVYSTGFATNIGVLGAILRSNDVAIVDMLAHASIYNGLNGKNKMHFLHNDMNSLEAVLKRANKEYANKLVIVEGIYSMDGDIANLPEISGLCKKYNAMLMVDEAHAFGVLGKNGLGVLDHFDMPNDSIDILVGTLSKAVGCTGGFVTGKKELITYLYFSSRSHIHSTAPFIASNAAALKSIQIIKEDSDRRARLWKNIENFKYQLTEGGYNIGKSESAILPIFLDHYTVLNSAKLLNHRGILVNAIPYPVVPRKLTRIRMTVTADMTADQINKGYSEFNAAVHCCDQINVQVPECEDLEI